MVQGNQRLAETIECKKPSTRHPRCIVYDIPNGIADVEVLEVLELTIGAPKDSLKPSFRIKGRGDCSHLVISGRPEYIKFLLNQKKVLINWKTHSIKEHFSVRRCFKCQRYGHIQTKCLSSKHYCAHCGHEHQTKYCRNNLESCINCHEENTQKGARFNIDHSASHNRCPTYLKEIARYRMTLQYE
ncbi:hypothetical protein HNY73_010045 [Argiope bruennichi]|uniref:CCHC-type domain-containing protein n=1 Tax=Argiope bruennichi TaxID=94029 RepID=A0A8T0EZX1_ARGBR|nr:hypothetical protein HNY73_010045 [Argiope bruennichi]